MFTVSHFPMHNNRSSFKGKTFCNKHQFNITWHPSTLHQDYELKPEEKKNAPLQGSTALYAG